MPAQHDLAVNLFKTQFAALCQLLRMRKPLNALYALYGSRHKKSLNHIRHKRHTRNPKRLMSCMV